MPQSIQCPECGGDAPAHDVGGLILEVCQECGGIWFGANQLSKFLAQGSEALDTLMGFEPAESEEVVKISIYKCPACKLPLHRNQLSGAPGIFVNTCYGCAGLFVEAADLAKLDELSHKPSAAVSPVFSPEAKATADAQERLTQADRRRMETMYFYMRQRETLGYGPRGIWL